MMSESSCPLFVIFRWKRLIVMTNSEPIFPSFMIGMFFGLLFRNIAVRTFALGSRGDKFSIN